MALEPANPSPADVSGAPTLSDAPIPVLPPAAPKPAPVSGSLGSSAILGGLDWLLAGLAVVFGFLIASFAVRNSDFWQHLAAGRLLAQGDYAFGTDPFSYTGEGRTWVNHAWLFDLGIYLLGTSGGAVSSGALLVVVKSVLVAGLAVLLLLMRPSGQGLWFGVVLTSLALLAAAPRLLLQPSLLSMVFLGATLALLLHRRDSKRLPLYVGILFAVWASCDAWFLLGPFALALFTLGEGMQTWLGGPAAAFGLSNADRGRPSAEQEGGSVPRTGPAGLRQLLLALGVGIAATLFNPHHVRVWQLPGEFGAGAWAQALAQDQELGQLFFRSGIEMLDFSGSRFGNPLFSWAVVLLLVLSFLGLALNIRRLRWAPLVLWVGFLALALSIGRAIPFCAVVAAGVGSWNLAEAATRFNAGPLRADIVSLFAFLRALGRVVTLLALAGLLFLAPPGWLHLFPGEALRSRPLAWAIESDGSLERAARALQHWREGDLLPSEARGLLLQPDLSHYVAWYAPGIKTFFDARLPFHGPEAADYVLFRRTLHLGDPEQGRKHQVVADLLAQHRISYVGVSSSSLAENRRHFQALLIWPEPWARSPAAPAFDLWDMVGRVSFFGRREQSTLSAEQYARLKFDPVRAVRSPDARPVPDAVANILAPDQGNFFTRYLNPPMPPSADSDEASLLVEYVNYFLAPQAQYNASVARSAVGGMPGLFLYQVVYQRPPPLVPPLEGRAAALLAVRAARRAVAVDPDSVEGHVNLGSAYQSPFYLTPNDYRNQVVLSSLTRALARASTERAQRRGSPAMHDVASLVADMHLRAGRFDLAWDYYTMYSRYLDGAVPAHMTEEERDARRKHLDTLRFANLAPQQFLEQRDIGYVNATSRLPPMQRAEEALRFGLFKEALVELGKVDRSAASQVSPPEKVGVTVRLIDLYLSAGMVEEAFKELAETETRLGDLMQHPQVREPLRQYSSRTAFLLGNLGAALQVQAEIGTQTAGAIKAYAAQELATSPVNLDRLPPRELLAQVQAMTWPLQPIAWPPERVAVAFILEQAVGPLYQYRNLLQLEADMHARQGLIALELGDNATAERHFTQALRPQGIEINFPLRGMVRDYLRLLAGEGKKDKETK